MRRYNPKEIEPRWQAVWEKQLTYKADLKSPKPKYYAMSMLNYPSGDGIHIGHAMNYTISDVLARFKRQQGYESYHPVGWDAFGLPAENYAIKTGVSPQAAMAEIIPNYHKQYKAMGWSNDWSKEISTHEPEYYKWTQWIFSEMYRKGLAYQDTRWQWWCSIDNTVLADEQVTAEGKCWRHDGPDDPLVEKREVKQWFFKITDYADELLEAIDDLNWTESVKLAQKNWIGRNAGAEIKFETEDGEVIPVFTTRPDTIFGATYLVLAPEHPLVDRLTAKSQKPKVESYVKAASRKTELERQAGEKDKAGIFTGSYAINPASQEKIPIWISDYVLISYGTGAIMAVPAHDEHDWQFARKYELPIVPVIEPVFGEAQGDEEHKAGVNVIVRDAEKDRAIVLDWGPRQDRWGGKMLIGGGVEPREDIIECAKREIAEETGYTDVELIAKSDAIGHGFYYSNVKNKNFSIDAYGLYFLLKSDKKSKTKLDGGETGKFKVTWVPTDKVAALLDDGIHRYFFETLALGRAYEGEGLMINSGRYDGMSSAEAREKIVADLAKKGIAQPKTTYRMRDWSVSRQRYWGAPIPVIHCSKCGISLVPDKDLPVILPELKDFQPTGDGRSALARATDWLKVDCPKCGGPAERETDTLDTYICSSWYFLRYLDPHNDKKIFDSSIADKWLPVDFYNGADHATAHMIYARFVTRFFHKLGLVDHPEPFKKFLFNGKVTQADGQMFSKSKNRIIDPLEIIDSGYGADALRTYLMFAAPLELWVRWDPKGVAGTYRFLNRVWNLTQEYLSVKDKAGAKVPVNIVHRAIKKTTKDLESLKYNTAIASLMQLVNDLYKAKDSGGISKSKDWQWALEGLVQLVAPFAPHIAEEMWQELGHETSVHISKWPTWDEKLVAEEMVTLAVQVNGKVRGEIVISPDASEEEATEAAKADPKVAEYLKGQKIQKTIYVPGRLVSLVIN